ncbi:ATP-dependent protease (CrgA) [Ascosphaera apis ARSEF 7405]|uniref:ATP-dependent protease (CrgA) n=1 Tax=Ascosphaera apis ARSEF 7405 TaxID=392613 RepID=A0A168AJK7_9EURO|nr:ATP-dependent protease (CrgA) [Ascosphaera apis ARSEF 7405]
MPSDEGITGSAQAMSTQQDNDGLISGNSVAAVNSAARSIIRLIQCPQCSRPFNDALRLPCGRSLCRACLPPTHRREYVTYPPIAGREEGFKCPFNAQFVQSHPEPVRSRYWATKLRPCNAEHSLDDCRHDITLNNIVSAFKEVLGKGQGIKSGAIDDAHAIGLVGTYALAERGELPYQSASNIEDPDNAASPVVADAAYISLTNSIQAELNCQLCFSLFMDPITTTCGHTYCRSCLSRALDQSNLCPFCRKELYIAYTIQSEPGNACISEILRTLAGDALRDRVQAFNVEGLGYSEFTTLPLFITTLGFPTMRVFLHVFEMRYRALIQHALSSGDKRFGLVMPNRARASYGSAQRHQFKSYGTMMLIERAEDFPDGRILVRAKGTSRFRILDTTRTTEGYILGQVQRVEDIPITEEETLELTETRDFSPIALGGAATYSPYDRMSTEELFNITKDYIRECREKGLPWITQRTLDAYGHPPTSAATYPYWVAALLPIPRQERYILLKTRSVRQRLKITAAWVKKLRSSEWSTEARPYTVL